MAGFTPFSPLQSPELLANPYPFYAMLRGSQPVLRVPTPGHSGPGVWLLTRYAEVQSALRDVRFSVDRTRAEIMRENATLLPAVFLRGGVRSMLIMDPPDHTRIRGLVNKAFTPRHVAGMRNRIEDIVERLLNDLDGQDEFDLISKLAEPLPAIVIAELLGVPVEDHRCFKQWSSQIVSLLGHPDPAEAVPRFEATLSELLAYLSDVIAARRKEPADDLISGMIQAQEEHDALNDDELLATSNLLLIAGHETTTNLIGNGTLALLRNPESLERLRRRPEGLKRAIDELLRYDSPVQATVRVATEDIELGGQQVQKGALVIVGIGAANHDPEVFDSPDQLDLEREPNPHLSFGFGAHFCLGAPLARLEAEIAFSALLKRFPELRLAGTEVSYRGNPILRGLRSLPVCV